MNILCLGGGPAGLYFAISMKLRDAAHQITVLERNRANDTFGWGVVLSDEALAGMQKNDPTSTEAIRANFAYWDDLAVIHDGVRTVSGGHGFAGIGRRALLVLLQARARELGVDLRFETEFKSAEEYRKDYDLVVASDGLNSMVRREYETVFRPEIDLRRCKFVWLGTHAKFADAFTFIFEKTAHGWVWAHVYQFDDTTATFPNNQHDAGNLALARRIHRHLLSTTGAADRGIRRARFMDVLRGQNRPAVLVEGGFLSNAEESQRINTPAYRQRLAVGVARALE